MRFVNLFYDLGGFLYLLGVSFAKFILPLKQHLCKLQFLEKMIEKETNQIEEQCYLAPDFDVVEIAFEQNILGGSSEQLDDYGGEDW